MVVGSFQSAIQLVAGTNVALFVLPSLHQPALDEERKRWSSLMEYALADESIEDGLREAWLEFWRLAQSIERDAAKGRNLALAFAVIYSVFLLWMSWSAEDLTAGRWLVFISIIGGLPALLLFKQNSDAKVQLARIRDRRIGLQRQAERDPHE